MGTVVKVGQVWQRKGSIGNQTLAVNRIVTHLGVTYAEDVNAYSMVLNEDGTPKQRRLSPSFNWELVKDVDG